MHFYQRYLSKQASERHVYAVYSLFDEFLIELFLCKNIFRTFVYFDLWWFLRLECEVTLEWGTNFMFLFVLFVVAQQSNLVK